MPRIKVCGVSDASFALGAAQRGVDYLGLVFANGSPRQVSPETAQSIVSAVIDSMRLDGSTTRPPQFVGVFVDHHADAIGEIASSAGLDVVQLHGDYDDSAVSALQTKGYKVWRLWAKGDDMAAGHEDAVLLDGRRGTTSGMADWSLVAPLKQANRRIVLAGGISATNIVDAMATGADVVDINSSLEIAPGVKSLYLLDKLLATIASSAQRRTDCGKAARVGWPMT